MPASLTSTKSGAFPRELIAPVYGRFSEGLDTDLRQAKALLEELAA
jgi:hypothetical protein